MLSDEEREQVRRMAYAGSYSQEKANRHLATVEAIARRAKVEALRDAASYFWNRPVNASLTKGVTASVFAELNQLADEYDREVAQ